MQSKLKVKILEHTPNPEKVIAEAGKLCYSSSTIDELEDKLTEDNIEKFINMLNSMGHESPLEHISFTFAIEGVSRSLTHQLVRHRIASYSQKSQRYVSEGQFEYIIPKEIENNSFAKQTFVQHMQKTQKTYDILVDTLLYQHIMEYKNIDYNANYLEFGYEDELKYFKNTNKKLYNIFEKKAIENARCVLPNACETKIIVTMNLRSLLHFFNDRCCIRAQDEIREMAYEMLKQCKQVSPLLFKNAGAKCVKLRYCPEGKMSCGLFITHEELLKLKEK